MVHNNELSEMLTVSEVARLIHVHPNTLRRWSDTGIIRALRITRRGDRRFRLVDVNRFLDDLNTHVDTKDPVSRK